VVVTGTVVAVETLVVVTLSPEQATMREQHTKDAARWAIIRCPVNGDLSKVLSFIRR
jgi:hypothetical protein